jgi:FkbM family methyltransferase
MAVDRSYGARLIDTILSHLPVAGTFIDVGAHVGGITLPAASHVGPEGRVLAFEPNPETATLLRRNVTKNLATNITVVQLACLDERKRSEFYVNDSSHSGKSSLSARNARSRRTVTVECDTLDSILVTHEVNRIDVVKIDVEGAELQVLKGMERLLRKFLPVVVLEIEPTLLESFSARASDLYGFLAAKGYRAESIDSTNVIFTCPSTRCPATANYQPPVGDASAPRLIRDAAQAAPAALRTTDDDGL